MSTNQCWLRMTTEIFKLRRLLGKKVKVLTLFIWSKIERIASYCKRRPLPLISFFFTIASFYLLFAEILPIDPDNVNYLLGSIWQGLVAVLAIVFSIVLVAGELASSYTPRMVGQVLRRTTIAYMFLFVSSAFLPLAILAGGETVSPSLRLALTRLSLGLTIACLSFLLPYFLSLREWLKPENLLNDLMTATKRELKQNQGRKLPEKVNSIRELILSSYNVKHYETFNTGIKALREIIIFATRFIPSRKVKEDKQAKGLKEEKHTTVAEQTVDILGDIGSLVVDDPLTRRYVVERLGECIQTTPDGPLASQYIDVKVLDKLEEIVNDVVSKGNEAIAKDISYSLGGIGERLIAQNLIGAPRILRILAEIEKNSLREKWDNAAKQVVGAVYLIGKKAIESDRVRVSNAAISLVKKIFYMTVEDMPSAAKAAAYELRALGEEAVEKERIAQLGYVLLALKEVVCKCLEAGIGKRQTQLSINSLYTLCGKASKKPVLLETARKGASALREVGEACMLGHPAVPYVAKQLWSLAANSPSEELMLHTLGELADLERKVGRSPIDLGFSKAEMWAQARNMLKLQKKLNDLRTLKEHRERISRDEYNGLHRERV